MGKERNPLAVSDAFRQTALAFPDKVKAAIALIDTPEVAADSLAKAQALTDYAKRIKATTEEINAVEYGKLLLAAKVGELSPAPTPQEAGAKGGRGKKGDGRTDTLFSRDTLKDYRKLTTAQEEGGIDNYWQANAKAEHENEMSMAGMFRFIGSLGDIKAHQNKGVIEWYTPAKYVEAVRKAMGGIDLDPASSDLANEIVKAKTYYTAEDDGLEYAWAGRVFMNPPFKASLIAPLIAKLCEHVESGEVKQAVLLTNNNTDTKWWHDAAELSTAICFTRGRVAFYAPGGVEASPTNGHTFFYFGTRLKSFCKQFCEIGTIMQVVSKEADDGER